MKIGILLCGHTIGEVAERHGDFAGMFENLLAGMNFEFQAYDVVGMEFPEDVTTCDGWLLSGSKHGVYEQHPFILPLESFIRQSYKTGVPLVGICFGHQIIAQALGGHVEKFKGGWSFGPQIYDFDGIGDVAANALHQDQVLHPPAGAKTIASNDFCKHAALVYGQPNKPRALTIQAHPEFTTDIMTTYVSSRLHSPEYGAGVVAGAETRLGMPLNDGVLAGMIADFFKNTKGTQNV